MKCSDASLCSDDMSFVYIETLQLVAILLSIEMFYKMAMFLQYGVSKLGNISLVCNIALLCTYTIFEMTTHCKSQLELKHISRK